MGIKLLGKDERRIEFLFKPFLYKTNIGYIVNFKESCLYEPTSIQLKEQVNKLFGLGYLPYHHYNSFRFGWRANKEKKCIELFTYSYQNGKREIEYFLDLNIDEYYTLEIYIISNSVYFYVSSQYGTFYKSVEIESKIVKKIKIGYELGLYFGGDLPSPNTMEIDMYKIK